MKPIWLHFMTTKISNTQYRTEFSSCFSKSLTNSSKTWKVKLKQKLEKLQHVHKGNNSYIFAPIYKTDNKQSFFASIDKVNHKQSYIIFNKDVFQNYETKIKVQSTHLWIFRVAFQFSLQFTLKHSLVFCCKETHRLYFR